MKPNTRELRNLANGYSNMGMGETANMLLDVIAYIDSRNDDPAYVEEQDIEIWADEYDRTYIVRVGFPRGINWRKVSGVIRIKL